MNNQGLFGALIQFWTIEDNPRLNRRNTYFRDHQPSNLQALRFCIIITVLAILMVVCWSVRL